MEPTNRSPVYHEKNDNYRIVSVHGGRWQAQRFVGGKGANKVKKTSHQEARDHFDPWTPLARPTTHDGAMAQMRVAAPPT